MKVFIVSFVVFSSVMAQADVFKIENLETGASYFKSTIFKDSRNFRPEQCTKEFLRNFVDAELSKIRRFCIDPVTCGEVEVYGTVSSCMRSTSSPVGTYSYNCNCQLDVYVNFVE